MQQQPDTVERKLARLARSSHGVVTRSELLGAGITAEQIRQRLRRGVGRRLIDCRWPGRRLTVELDGYPYHASRHAWEQDRLREREAYARGDEFRRYTYGDVFERPQAMLVELRKLLAAHR